MQLNAPLVFCFELCARAVRTCCHCHLAVKIQFMTCGQFKTAKKVMNGTTVWSCDTDCVQMASKQPNVKFSLHIFQFTRLHAVSLTCRDCHSETPWSHSSKHPGGTYCQAQDFLLRTNYTLEMWCANTKLANQVPTSPVKHLSFQCLEVIVALNGKRASMLLEPTKNTLKQWRVIEKSVNKCNFFPDILKL